MGKPTILSRSFVHINLTENIIIHYLPMREIIFYLGTLKAHRSQIGGEPTQSSNMYSFVAVGGTVGGPLSDIFV